MHKCGVDVNDGFVHDVAGNGSNGRSQTACQVGQLRGKACFGDEHDELLVLESRDRKGVGRVAWRVGHFSVDFGLDGVVCDRKQKGKLELTLLGWRSFYRNFNGTNRFRTRISSSMRVGVGLVVGTEHGGRL